MSKTSVEEKILFIAEAACRACSLEVCADKPGNVSPERSFRDTSFRDFLRGAEALKPAVAEAAVAGFKAGVGRMHPGDVGLGSLIKKVVSDVKGSHSGGNTHLGVALLFIPLACSAGMCLGGKKGFGELREGVRSLLSASTVDDAVKFFEAVNLSGAGGLPDASYLDVRDENSIKKLREDEVTFLRVLRISAERDAVARELSLGLPILFDVALPVYAGLTARLNDLSDAIIQTYLFLLSKYPDTLIAKKAGCEEASRVSALAKNALDAGGVLTGEGRRAIKDFDSALRSQGNILNPGATADFTAATIFLFLLRDVLA